MTMIVRIMAVAGTTISARLGRSFRRLAHLVILLNFLPLPLVVSFLPTLPASHLAAPHLAALPVIRHHLCPLCHPPPVQYRCGTLLVPVVLATPCRTDNRTNATLTRDCIVAGSLVGAGSVIRFAIVQVVSTTKITPPLRPRTRHRQLHLRHLRVRV